MCTLVQVGATLPYRGGQKAAKYQVYEPDDISLPAQTAVQILLGYRVNLQPLLIIHVCYHKTQEPGHMGYGDT